MTLLLQLTFVFSIFAPCVSLTYLIASPEAPIFPNTVLVPWLTGTFPGIPVLWESTGLFLDAVLLLHVCYFGVGTVMVMMFSMIIYIGLSERAEFANSSKDMISPTFLGIGPLTQILPEFRGDCVKSHRATDNLRIYAHLSVEYACILLLNKEVMDNVGLLMVYAHAMSGHFIVACNYVLIGQWKHLDGWTLVNKFWGKLARCKIFNKCLN